MLLIIRGTARFCDNHGLGSKRHDLHPTNLIILDAANKQARMTDPVALSRINTKGISGDIK